MEKRTAILKKKQRVITRAVFWKIQHDTPKEDIRLKIGRYEKPEEVSVDEYLELTNPKSELTLDCDEFLALIDFIQTQYEPFKSGIKNFISIESRDSALAEQIKKIINQKDKQKALEYITQNNLISDEVMLGLRNAKRFQAIVDFENMLVGNFQESVWQKWFEQNSWVLGSGFVRLLSERVIDKENIADFLTEAYDGFLDIIEIKKPSSDLKFWASSLDHGNNIPSSDLVKAVTQAVNYIYNLELEANNIKFFNRVGCVRAIKPRCTLIFGRSNNWNAEQSAAYRILNASYHNITILTYDHVLSRAKQITGLS